MAYPEVSVSTRIFHLGWGMASIRGFVILFLSLLKAFFSSSCHFYSFFPINSVSGLATCANPGMNLQ